MSMTMPEMALSWGGTVSGVTPAREDQDNTALDAFLSGVERRALRMAEMATGHREEALDIVQDAMLQLVSKYARRDPTLWGALFHRILQNRIRDWYRRQAVRQRVLAWWVGGRHAQGEDTVDGDILDSFPDPRSTGPEQGHAQARFATDLEQALQILPLRQQQTFLLRVWEGLDVAQTAHAMGISAGSVKTHYSRALATLRISLEAYRP